MVAIAKSGTPSLCSTLPPQSQQLAGNLRAGEALAAGDACYIASTGLVLRSTGAAANAAAKVRGYAAEACAINEAVTLWFDVNFWYTTGATPGIDVFLSGTTAGGLDTAASTGGTAPIGYTIDANRVHLFASRY
jgi:hypothetical protein